MLVDEWCRAWWNLLRIRLEFKVEKSHKKKRELNPYPPTKPLRRPHRNDKSKAHAVWREHFADLFLLWFAKRNFLGFWWREQ